MRRDRGFVDEAHQQYRHREHAAFERHRHTNRQAQSPDFAEPCPVWPPKPSEQMVTAEFRVEADHQCHHAELDAVGDCAADTGPHQPKLWQSEITKDQTVIDDGVQYHRANRNDRCPNRFFKRRDKISQHKEANERQDRPHIKARKNRRVGGYAGLLSGQ